MPLPFLIGAIAVAAGATGLGTGIHGAVKMMEAKDTAEAAQSRNDRNIARLKDTNKRTLKVMDALGENEQKIQYSFKRFTEAWKKIQNPPEFHEINSESVVLSSFEPKELEDVSVGSGVLLGGLGGAAAGTFGGFAAAGGTTAAVMALGTASTGATISSLGGVAATNATLAALGGGSLAAGGGGVALGTAILGGATLGVGLLIGGLIFNFAGSSISDKADEAWREMKKNEEKIDAICAHLDKLRDIASRFDEALSRTNDEYAYHLAKLEDYVKSHKKFLSKKADYNKFSDEEKLVTKNTVLLVKLLYAMCSTKLVKKSENKDDLGKINESDTIDQIEKSESLLQDIAA